jgi:cell cycle checkpoint protein
MLVGDFHFEFVCALRQPSFETVQRATTQDTQPGPRRQRSKVKTKRALAFIVGTMSQVPSSSQEIDWRRRRRPPPARLSWPAGSSQGTQLTQAQSSQQDDDRKPSARKRPRKSAVQEVASLDSSSSSSMWVDKHAPKSSTELCVAPKKVKEVRSWMESATANQASGKKLLVLVGSPGIGKSTMLRLLAKDLGLSACDWNESHNPRTYAGGSSGLMSVEESSPLDSFEAFLQQSGAGFSSLQLTNITPVSSISPATTSSSSQHSIILLEDLPNLHGSESELRFRKLISNHLKRSQVPTVLIFSDVSEGKHRPDDLERLIDPKDLYSESMSTILQIHPVTKPKMKKILERIASLQGCQVPSVFWEQVHDQSRGDLRHAILTLQLESSGRASLVTNQLRHNDRDVKLSTFHALGKLLYAKRTLQHGKMALAYDPELTMERSDMGLAGSLGFLEYHSVDFFQDITELSNAMDYYSDAATLLDFPMDVS